MAQNERADENINLKWAGFWPNSDSDSDKFSDSDSKKVFFFCISFSELFLELKIIRLTSTLI